MIDDLDRQIEQLKRCEYIKESEVRDLWNIAKEILIDEPNIQTIFSPITVSFIYCSQHTQVHLLLICFLTFLSRFAETSTVSSTTY